MQPPTVQNRLLSPPRLIVESSCPSPKRWEKTGEPQFRYPCPEAGQCRSALAQSISGGFSYWTLSVCEMQFFRDLQQEQIWVQVIEVKALTKIPTLTNFPFAAPKHESTTIFQVKDSQILKHVQTTSFPLSLTS